jgi:hypothetical protein
VRRAANRQWNEKKWPLGLRLYWSFKQGGKEDEAINGSFSRSLTTVCHSVLGAYKDSPYGTRQWIDSKCICKWVLWVSPDCLLVRGLFELCLQERSLTCTFNSNGFRIKHTYDVCFVKLWEWYLGLNVRPWHGCGYWRLSESRTIIPLFLDGYGFWMLT